MSRVTSTRGTAVEQKRRTSEAAAPAVTPAWDAGGGLSVAEVAARLSVSTRTVRRLLKAGTLKHVKIGRRVVVTATSVADLLEQAT